MRGLGIWRRGRWRRRALLEREHFVNIDTCLLLLIVAVAVFVLGRGFCGVRIEVDVLYAQRGRVGHNCADCVVFGDKLCNCRCFLSTIICEFYVCTKKDLLV